MTFRVARAWILVLLMIAVQPPIAFGADPNSQYIREISSASTVIVFVHGVLGDGKSTWKNGNTYWPELLASDPVFDGTSIYVYSYPTGMWANLSIDELAENMRLQLGSDGVTSYRKIIFLSHSMGGLVTRAYLLKNRDIAAKTAFAYFYSTPTGGSQVATIASLLSNNPQLGKMKPMNAEDYLADVLRQWLAAEFRFPSYCAYEKQATYGLSVVTFQSASALCTRALDPIDADHINIVKPLGNRAPTYEAFKAAYRREITAALPTKLLRIEVQGLKQVKETIGAPPTRNGQRVFCDSVRMTLVLAHNQQGPAPIRINSLAVNAAAIDDKDPLLSGSCSIDPLSARAYGIVDSDAFLITLTDSKLIAKYFRSLQDIAEVSGDDLLRVSGIARAVTLRPGEEPVGFDILFQSKTRQPREVTFTVQYDEDGSKELSTTPFIIWR